MLPEMMQFLAALNADAGYSANTRLAYRYDLKRCADFLTQHNGGGAGLTRDAFQKFLDSEARAGRSPRTMARRLVVLRRFTLFLKERQLIERDFGPALTLTGLEAVNAKRGGLQPLTASELDKVRQLLLSQQGARPKRDLAIVETMLASGLAVGRLVGMDVRDVDLAAGAARARGAGLAQVVFRLEKAEDALRRYLLEGRPDLEQGRDERALFISQQGRRMTRQAVWAMLKTLSQTAGLATDLSPNRIRDTAVIALMAKGLSLEQMQAQLGHRTPVSTRALVQRLGFPSRSEKVYTQTNPQYPASLPLESREDY